ncbi:Inosine/uridine-preferring nucleoside hydrolase domain-containing protein [Mycena olivaceomarginata]|nr:Inosine/uridine-preferring nucleoside hydrolase domain-containing protein [Mycena olivaceomarginata]
MTLRTPVIISTDPGVDDIVAILFALASPELEILAFITSFGFINVLKAYQAVSRHLEQFPQDSARFPNFNTETKPILASGSVGPLEGDLHSAQYFHGRLVEDGLTGISERHPELDVESSDSQHPQLTITDLSGVEVASQLIQNRPARTVTYIALGPLTDLAWLMNDNATLVRDRIGRIVCMGGALDVPGNTSPFNFFADPYAVKKLLLPFPFYKDKVDPAFESSAKPSDPSSKSPLTHFTSSFLEHTRVVMNQFGKDAMELHDIVAMWCAIENPPVPDGGVDNLAPGWRARSRVFDIERTGELTRGFLVVDRRLDLSAYAPGANRAEVQAELDKHSSPHGAWESTAVPALVETEQAPRAVVAQGVICVHATPGPATLLKLLTKRVWGVVV